MSQPSGRALVWANKTVGSGDCSYSHTHHWHPHPTPKIRLKLTQCSFYLSTPSSPKKTFGSWHVGICILFDLTLFCLAVVALSLSSLVVSSNYCFPDKIPTKRSGESHIIAKMLSWRMDVGTLCRKQSKNYRENFGFSVYTISSCLESHSDIILPYSF